MCRPIHLATGISGVFTTSRLQLSEYPMLPLAIWGQNLWQLLRCYRGGLEAEIKPTGASQQSIDINVDILPRRGSVVVGYSGSGADGVRLGDDLWLDAKEN